MASAAVEWTAPAIAGGQDRPERHLAVVPGPLRSPYRPSRRSRPVAVIASAGIGVGLTAAIALLNVAVPPQTKSELKVVSLNLMPDEPPPPPPAPAAKPEPSRPAIVAPVPIVRTPTPPPLVAIAQVAPPPDPAPPVSASTAPGTAPVMAPPAPPVPPAPVDGGDLSAKMISATPPTYPLDSRRRREQGVVKLTVLVGTDGRVQDVDIASSSGSARLDRAALGAVRRWRWSPVIRNGAAVLVRGIVTIPFVLKG